mmetsp:Transcript_28128/g.86224  ORF Transcript_28128/g.86224 Transcript_28128/m.86224 type:complete len:402 (-) Transcript_28128:619-1824(-)
MREEVDAHALTHGSAVVVGEFEERAVVLRAPPVRRLGVEGRIVRAERFEELGLVRHLFFMRGGALGRRVGQARLLVVEAVDALDDDVDDFLLVVLVQKLLRRLDVLVRLEVRVSARKTHVRQIRRRRLPVHQRQRGSVVAALFVRLIFGVLLLLVVLVLVLALKVRVVLLLALLRRRRRRRRCGEGLGGGAGVLVGGDEDGLVAAQRPTGRFNQVRTVRFSFCFETKARRFPFPSLRQHFHARPRVRENDTSRRSFDVFRRRHFRPRFQLATSKHEAFAGMADAALQQLLLERRQVALLPLVDALVLRLPFLRLLDERFPFGRGQLDVVVVVIIGRRRGDFEIVGRQVLVHGRGVPGLLCRAAGPLDRLEVVVVVVERSVFLQYDFFRCGFGGSLKTDGLS